ncbi:MAG: putative lipid II flippase FtsW [Actinobacteria bacterium]|nr:putative lipid II flippase FtsW [Actinomycetota bacterium]
MVRGKIKDRHIYYRLFGLIFVMVLFGLIMVLSASSARAFDSTGDSYYYIKRQLISVAIGSVALLFFSQIPVRSLQKLALPAIIAAILMLFTVLIPELGKTTGGASRWIPIGGFRIQPSEFAKLAVILYTADFLTKRRKFLGDFKEIYPYSAVMILIILLVMKQPDMGTTLAICMAAFVMIFIGGFNLGYVIGIGTAGLITGAYLIYSASYRLERITAFLNPMADPLGKRWQIMQSLIAFGSGGLFGVGLGMSKQKYFYLPAAHTDFIFAIIGEELGLLGALFTISLFAFFAYYGIRVSFRCKDHFGRLLGAGLTSMIVLQALVNMGAVTAMLPITGIPMPFISYGGSSLIINLASAGILLSIAVENRREASSRRRGPKLFLVQDEKAKNRETTGKKRGIRRGLSKRLARSPNTRSKTSSKKSSTGTTKSKVRRVKASASGDKRRRNSRTRVPGSSSRRSSSKNKRRS